MTDRDGDGHPESADPIWGELSAVLEAELYALVPAPRTSAENGRE